MDRNSSRDDQFQVPKGMLQTRGHVTATSGVPSCLFQVPKGMLQTQKGLIVDRWEKKFQVPKGMLQTV